jgi:hypothetical protein
VQSLVELLEALDGAIEAELGPATLARLGPQTAREFGVQQKSTDRVGESRLVSRWHE